jgi:hypothetical protein
MKQQLVNQEEFRTTKIQASSGTFFQRIMVGHNEAFQGGVFAK